MAAEGTAPLKLLVPRHRGRAVWAYVATFGGGLLPGDHIALDVDVGPGASLLLATQASTKIYRGGERPAQQQLRARVAEGGLCAVLPDPIVCFADAVYRQRQRFDLEPGASLVVCDWLSSGRAARDERWQLRSYRSTTEVFRGGEARGDRGALVVRDAVALEATPHSRLLDRFGAVDVFATVLLLGPALASAAAALVGRIAAMPVDPTAALHASASPIDVERGRSRGAVTASSAVAGGAILRVAGRRVEDVAIFLRRELAALPELLGDDPWARR